MLLNWQEDVFLDEFPDCQGILVLFCPCFVFPHFYKKLVVLSQLSIIDTRLMRKNLTTKLKRLKIYTLINTVYTVYPEWLHDMGQRKNIRDYIYENI